jgi:hypothetical protein
MGESDLAMIERSRQLLNSPEHHEERTEFARLLGGYGIVRSLVSADPTYTESLQQRSRRHCDETEFMNRVVLGICLDGSDYERRGVFRGFLSHNR